jgi:hypothetical protein
MLSVVLAKTQLLLLSLDQIVPIRKEFVFHPFDVVRQVGVVGFGQRLLGDGRVLGDGHEPEDNAVDLRHLVTEI